MAPFGARTGVCHNQTQLSSPSAAAELSRRQNVCTGPGLRGRASTDLGDATGEVRPSGGQKSPGAAVQHEQTFDLRLPPSLDVRRHALFLDLDGTLVEFAAHPEQVVASTELRELLTDLSRAMNGAVALVTGRSIASADAVLNGVLVHIAGIHGFERRAGEATTRAGGDTSAISRALTDARAMIATGALDADVEDKGAALALHYRRAPGASDAVRRAAAELAHHHGLSVLEGNMVVELTLGQRTKGDAIADFMADAPFAGRTPVAIGDDITDEDAFTAAERMNGVSVLVGPPRDTAARFQLQDTRAVMAWLAAGLAR
jgi:trehalose 6-phosphate phosphatase